eukprot:TRINITY_DN8265_c0_g1_i1.p1 TRINITY_DN8265_c0_g1~~TRINITY_DN8265_c0_g1_i1.p1  ORF type:complete len:128 (+),score=28.30 TRINITY_DN8265_c0_g1_i1:43-426(+)
MSSTDRTRDRSPTSNDGKRSPERIGNGGHRSLSDMRVEALRRAAPELSSAPPSTHKQWDNTLKLYRNENGGIAIDEDEIQAAFNFLDINETGEIDKHVLHILSLSIVTFVFLNVHTIFIFDYARLVM